MLRWCQWTVRALDGYGHICTSGIRFHSLTSGSGSVKNHGAPTRLPSDENFKNGKQVVTLAVGTQLGPAHKTRFTRAPGRNASSHELASPHQCPNVAYGMKATGKNDTTSTPINVAKLVHTSNTKASVSSSSAHSSSIPSRIPTTILADAVTSITRLLFPGSMAEGGESRSIDSLISLYHKATEQAVLQHLNGGLFSELISLVGTISEGHTREPHAFDSSLLSYFVLPTTPQDMWPFVLQVGRDKEESGLSLCPSDQYWMMRAYLAQAERSYVATSRSAMLEIISSARVQYETFKNCTEDPQVHIPYLQALLSSDDFQCIQEAVRHLCDLLRRSKDPNPRIVGIFWQLISSRGSALSLKSREMLCNLALHHTHPYTTAAAHNPVNPASPKADSIHKAVLRMSHITSEFAAVVLRCSTSHYSSTFTSRWAVKQARKALAPSLSLDTRWNNLSLLAMHLSPKGVPQQCVFTSLEAVEPGSSIWHTALILASVERWLPREASELGPIHEVIKKIIHPLWIIFAGTEHEGRPIDINRAFIATFLRIAAKTNDRKLQAVSFQLSQGLGLWTYHQSDSHATKAQAIDNIVAYASGFVATQGQDWNQLYTTIRLAQPNPSWETNISSALLRHYASDNIDVAYRLYLHTRRSGVDISSSALQAMFLALAAQERWTMIIPLLNDPSLSREHVEFLLGASLRVFQIRKYESADTNLVKHLARIACNLYAEERPPASLKYPLRYFFSVMIWTRNTSVAVKLITSVHKSAPEFFTVRLIHRLQLQLIRCREISSALKLYREFSGGGVVGNRPRVLDDIRHKLTFRALRSGAYKQVGTLDGGRPTQISSITRRETLLQVVGLRRFPSSSSLHRSVRLLVSLAGTRGPILRDAISTLVKHRRLHAARVLYAKVQASLDPKTRVAVGNIILHGSLLKHSLRNGRLVRHVLQTKDLLVKHYGFVPDRTTINIILKVLLQWKAMVDTGRIRRLFDQIVRDGYPVPDHWRRQHGVPFGSPPRSASAGGFAIPSLSAHISFSRHVRPMYKMFIKSFFLRNDRVAARTVVGILKEVQRAEMEERERRNRARRQGVIKKKMKLVAEGVGHSRGF